MADFELYFPLEINLEGSAYENVPGDSGGCTKYGLTLQDLKEYHIDVDHDGEFTCNDVKLLNRQQAHDVLKKLYWDYFRADLIPNQSLAEYIVDTGLNQGRPFTVKAIQSIVNVDIDGMYGDETFEALLHDINADSAKDEFEELYQKRLERYNNIVKNNPTQKKFLRGWINRLNAIKYE